MNHTICKLLLVVFVGIFSTFFSDAKSRVEDIIKDGTTWVGEELPITSPKIREEYDKMRYVMKIEGSVYLNNHDYFKLMCLERQYQDEFQPWMIDAFQNGFLIALLRIEDGKVYVLNMRRRSEVEPEEYLYFDFNLQEGEKCTVGYNFLYRFEELSRPYHLWNETDMVCLKKGTISSCGNTFEVTYVDSAYLSDMPGIRNFWIDGIGAMNVMWNGTENKDYWYPGIHKTPYGNIDYVLVDGEIVYRSSDFDTNIISDINNSSSIDSTDGDEDQYRISKLNIGYDINGRRVSEKSSPIIISGGHKILKR